MYKKEVAFFLPIFKTLNRSDWLTNGQPFKRPLLYRTCKPDIKLTFFILVQAIYPSLWPSLTKNMKAELLYVVVVSEQKVLSNKHVQMRHSRTV